MLMLWIDKIQFAFRQIFRFVAWQNIRTHHCSFYVNKSTYFLLSESGTMQMYFMFGEAPGYMKTMLLFLLDFNLIFRALEGEIIIDSFTLQSVWQYGRVHLMP